VHVRPPALRVDHVSIAVHAIEPALERFRRVLPIRMRVEPRAGYDDQFRWTDFYVGDFKLELIESARPGSFVERFLARHGEGFHHLSMEVEDGALDRYVADLERGGLRIVDRADYGDGDATAFISPRTSPGVLIQFWQVPGFRGGRPADVPTDPIAERDGVRFRVDHLAVAVRSIDDTLGWFHRFFPCEPRRPKHRGWDGTFELASFFLAGYKMELLQPTAADGPIGRFLARHGEGLHHVSVDVDRLDAVVDRLGADGFRIVGRATLGGGRKTAFIHPADLHGILVQLWQEPDFGGRLRP
jgi:methylmalonyl-CoA/ethylmalonyl-CoA epimerase